MRLYNNIMYSRVGGLSNFTKSNVNVLYDYNIYFNGSVAVKGAHDIVGDPKLVNPGIDPTVAGVNFKLAGDSPAINSGVYLSGATPNTDIIGTPRSSRAGIDRGAYEALTPRITSAANPAGAVGAAMSYTIVADNYATSYSAIGLPDGVSLNTVTGVISGTPVTAGEADVSVSAKNNVGTYSMIVHFTINTPL